jgi:hypothetical protein
VECISPSASLRHVLEALLGVDWNVQQDNRNVIVFCQFQDLSCSS